MVRACFLSLAKVKMLFPDFLRVHFCDQRRALAICYNNCLELNEILNCLHGGTLPSQGRGGGHMTTQGVI